jgi:D-alanyl-D-alanine carboxypeptidase
MLGTLTTLSLIPAATGRAAITPEQRTALQQAVDETKAQGQYPGLVVGVWQHGEGSFVSTTGVSDLRTEQPIRATQPLRIGSITKTFTATLILRLVQHHRLGLNDHVSRFVSGVPFGRRITIRELLNHTSGIPDISTAFQDTVFADPQRDWRPRQVIKRALRHPRYCEPGACWHYSNTNYLLLGRIARKVTHRSLSTLYRNWVFDRIGLHETSFRTEPKVPEATGHGYLRLVEGQPFMDTTHWSLSWGWSAAAMVSTLADLKHYARALATGSHLLDRPTQRKRLQFVNASTSGISGMEYGLGILKLGPFLGHDGQVPGYESIMLYSPAEKMTIVELGNTSPSLNAGSSTNSSRAVALWELANEIVEIVEPAQR